MLLTFRQYAAHAGLNVSSVSRAVASGHIPTVNVDGERRIDPVAADTVRLSRDSKAKSSEQIAAANALWRAKAGSGFDHGQHILLSALTSHGPRLIAEGMRIAGSKDEIDIARAAAAMREIVEIATVLCFKEGNAAGIGNYTDVLPEPLQPPLSEEGLRLFVHFTDPDKDPDFDRDAEPWPDRWYNLLFEALKEVEL